MHSHWYHRITLLLILSICFTSSIQTTFAHGDEPTPRLFRSPTGSYAVSLWIYPDFLRVGTSQMEIAVFESINSGQMVTDLDVIVELSNLDGQSEPTLHQAAVSGHFDDNQHYLVDVNIEEAGHYQVKVLVNDEAGFGGEAGFETEVLAVTGMQWVVSFLMLQALLFTAWLLKEGIATWGLRDKLLARATVPRPPLKKSYRRHIACLKTGKLLPAKRQIRCPFYIGALQNDSNKNKS